MSNRAYRVTWDGEKDPTEVSWEATGEGISARLNDDGLELELLKLPDGGMLARLASGRQIRVDVSRLADGSLVVRAGGGTQVARVMSDREARLERIGGGAGASGGKVTITMPGKVVKVQAQVGDAVTAGQSLFIVEAMKMENEVKAAVSGVVVEVAVSVGESVEAGAMLARVEEQEGA